jgi:hypothetical protein
MTICTDFSTSWSNLVATCNQPNIVHYKIFLGFIFRKYFNWNINLQNPSSYFYYKRTLDIQSTKLLSLDLTLTIQYMTIMTQFMKFVFLHSFENFSKKHSFKTTIWEWYLYQKHILKNYKRKLLFLQTQFVLSSFTLKSN